MPHFSLLTNARFPWFTVKPFLSGLYGSAPSARTLAIALGLATGAATGVGAACVGGKPVYWEPEPSNWSPWPGFPDSLAARLKPLLPPIGHCLIPGPFPTGDTADALILLPFVQGSPRNSAPALPDWGGDPEGNSRSVVPEQGSSASDADTEFAPAPVQPPPPLRTLSIGLMEAKHRNAAGKAAAEARPLVSIPYGQGDLSSFLDVAAAKTAENLRQQWVVHLQIRTDPPGARVQAPTLGLQAASPLEWVMPLGVFPVRIEAPNLRPVTQSLDLREPGRHTMEFVLSRRRFYHSKFIWPTLASGMATVAAYILENQAYRRYQSLDDNDLRDRPDAFGKTFAEAQFWEKATWTSLALTGTFLSLSFVF